MTLRPILTLKALLMSSCLLMLQAKAPNSPCSTEDHQLAETYIRSYLKVAIDEMERVGMPASVIIAQGMLESSFGQSELAQTANNHFGIKCHKGWSGETYYHRTNEHNKDGLTTERHCFRAYDDVEDSYHDHSEFLTSREHYKFLFDAKNLDYKFWAEGLLKAKYATDPAYATKLIALIETYDLARYDKYTNKYKVPGQERINEFQADPTIETTSDVLALNVRMQLLEQSLHQAILFQKEMQEFQASLKAELQNLRQQYQGSKVELSDKIADLDENLAKQNSLIAEMQSELAQVESIQKVMLKADPLSEYFHEDGTPKKQLDIFPTRHRNADGIFYQSGRRATTLGEGQSFQDIANIYNIDIKELRRFNELETGEEANLPKGCFIYLETKANMVTGEPGPHTVQLGEDMHSISQRYGIKISKLYQRNFMKKGEEPTVGEYIFLNENTDKKPRVRTAMEETSDAGLDRFGGGGSK